MSHRQGETVGGPRTEHHHTHRHGSPGRSQQHRLLGCAAERDLQRRGHREDHHTLRHVGHCGRRRRECETDLWHSAHKGERRHEQRSYRQLNRPRLPGCDRRLPAGELHRSRGKFDKHHAHHDTRPRTDRGDSAERHQPRRSDGRRPLSHPGDSLFQRRPEQQNIQLPSRPGH